MCGICGVIQVRGQAAPVIAPAGLDRMTDAMAHRGPNDRGTYLADGIALGARRLSVVDVEGGHQPFSNETADIWAVQNGEIFNHADLRSELAADGHRFDSRCDTEVLPHLYERWDTSFPERLRGMFAIALWDERRRRAVLVRDRLGIKPLYYADTGDLVVFASELKSLLASGLVSTALDYDAIDAYLTIGFVPGPRTPLAQVKKLPPGHRLVVEDGKVTVEAYWRYPRPVLGRGSGSLEEYSEGLLEQMETSVRLRLMSDVPLGAMLSGGLDSSVIVGLMARQMSESVKTFSVGFAEAGDANELGVARSVADFYGADHHELELSLSDPVDLAELIWHLDEPLADLSSIGFLALSELASRHVTVALSGQGADELLGGYRKHRAAALAGWGRRVPGAAGVARLAAGRVPAGLARPVGTLASANPADRLLTMSGHLDRDQRRELARGRLAEVDGNEARRAALERLDGLPDDPLPAALYLDAQLGLVDDMLHYFDRASMAYSLEVRVPFLDHHVVEYCAAIPARFKVSRLRTKHVLKHAARGLVPDEVIDRPKVGFFNSAVESWFRAQTRGAVSDYLLGPSPRYAELLDRDAVERLVARHAAGDEGGGGHSLLSVLMLEVWLSSYLPRATGRPEPIRESIAVADVES